MPDRVLLRRRRPAQLFATKEARRQRRHELNLYCSAGRRLRMADIFISFKTDDTPRVQAVYDGFRGRGLTVFWSNDIPIGAPNYQAIIKDEGAGGCRGLDEPLGP
jgi:hypothetical protein